MRSLWLICLSLVLALAAAPSRAYTPESGTWWSPNEPGTGLFIEVQDNFLVAAAYVYDPIGNATWYTATGFLTGNARFDGQLDAFVGGQCIGCPWRPNSERLGAGGPIRIDFNLTDPTKANLTWGGRTRPIERFQFYLKRPEDGNRSIQLTKMLGEWQLVLDFSSLVSNFPYYGDVIVFDEVDTSAATDYVLGCRARNSLDGFCTDAAFRDHQAAAFYDDAVDRLILVVEDSPTNNVTYVLRVGTSHVEGEFSVHRRDTLPTVFADVRGFRSASRSYVEEGIGPSKSVQQSPPLGLGLGLGLSDAIGDGVVNRAAEARAVMGVPPERLAKIVNQLSARLEE